jgi:hypothetical protein
MVLCLTTESVGTMSLWFLCYSIHWNYFNILYRYNVAVKCATITPGWYPLSDPVLFDVCVHELCNCFTKMLETCPLSSLLCSWHFFVMCSSLSLWKVTMFLLHILFWFMLGGSFLS